jgi:hypothetical protein
MSDRPAIDTSLTVRSEDGMVLIEPGPVHGICGFTMILSQDRAKSLGYELIAAATRLLPATTKGGGE